MQGYQSASLVDATKCHPDVSRKHVAHLQFQPVWAAIDDNTKQFCNIPICSVLKGGSPDFVTTKDKCKSLAYFCQRVGIHCNKCFVHRTSLFLRPSLPPSLSLSIANKFTGMNWHFSNSSENVTSSDSYFLPVEFDALLVLKDDEYVETVLKNGSMCFGLSMSSDPRQHRVCASVHIGPLSRVVSSATVIASGLLHNMLLLADEKMPPVTLSSGITRVAITLVFCAAVFATLGEQLVVAFRVSFFVTLVDQPCMPIPQSGSQPQAV